MNLPKISVVTITYGHEKYIRETLDGVLMQQYPGPIEFIIANDNSPDKTDEVVKTYFQEHPAPENFEIKYTRHQVNKGMMPNSIWAMEQATGKYIALCEGDDYWTDPLKLQKQFSILEKDENIGLVYTDVDIHTIKSNETINAIYASEISRRSKSFPEHLINKGYLAPLTWVIRNSVLRNVLQYLKNSADPSFELALRIFLQSEIFYLNQVTGVHNILPESASNHSSDIKKYHYLKGIFDIQKRFINDYVSDPTIYHKIYFQTYLDLRSYARSAGDTEFLNEVKLYLVLNVPKGIVKDRIEYVKGSQELQKKNIIQLWDDGEHRTAQILQKLLFKSQPISKFRIWLLVYATRKKFQI